MRRTTTDAPRQKPTCVEHKWFPLFHEPGCEENVMTYMTYGLADYLLCSQCGAVGLVEGNAPRKAHLLSDGFADRKKREAADWNAKQIKKPAAK